MLNWKRNPKAPSSLWDGLVFDGAYAGLHPGTNRFVDGSGLENHGTLMNMDAATDWAFVPELGRWQIGNGIGGTVNISGPTVSGTQLTFAWWFKCVTDATGVFAEFWAVGNQIGSFSLNYGRVRRRIRCTNSVLADTSYGALNQFMDGVWRHSCSVSSVGSQKEQFFLDGNYVQEKTAAWTGTLPTRIGRLLMSLSPGHICDALSYDRALARAEISWLANRANRLYVPDTRRHFWFPMSRPWLYSEVNHHIGMGLGV